MQTNFLPNFQYFGSSDSQDIDILYFIAQLPSSISESAALIASFSAMYKTEFPTVKPINGNLAVCENGRLKTTFKGNLDELNNALFLTYHLHEQVYPNHIERLFVRDVNLKFLRACRSILSYLTKTEQRLMIKEALKGDVQLKCNVLKIIDLRMINFENTKMSLVDIGKGIAFQMGQSLALQQGQELYSKKEIAVFFPILKPYLERKENQNFDDLQAFLQHFIAGLEKQLPEMSFGFEYEYVMKY
jgi:hypothetical protein